MTNEVSIELSIAAELCGPISIGTAAVTRALMAHLDLSLTDAVAIVDRCVFDAERVTIQAASRTRAESLLRAWRALPAAPRIDARIAD